MFLSKRLLLALLLLAGLCFTSCKKDDPDEREMFIDENFDLGGTTWFFQNVSGDGLIGGVETTDDDPNPTGFITFEDDGTGFAEFGINLLNQSYGKTEIITWRRLSNEQVEITESDGDVDLWSLIRANEFIIEADWEVFISPENNAVITAILTPTP